jgi:uncharacterized protein (TIGR02453 family)
MNPERYFKGFTAETFAFLQENRFRNSKDWFEQYKPRYETLVFSPLRELVIDLAPTIQAIDDQIEVRPAINKTISRIYRDTRFSKDKSLFREDIWISFKRRLKLDYGLPEFYFYATPQHFEYGMGYYSADKEAMDRFKAAIVRNPESFRRALDFMHASQNPFVLISEKYRKGNTAEIPEEFRDWMLLKTFCFAFKREFDDSLFSAKLVGEVVEGYNLLAPLYQFIVFHAVDNLGSRDFN